LYLCVMESTRQQKISRLIQKDLSTILQMESRNLFGGAMITVTKVNVTRDLAVARTFVSLFGTKDKPALLEMIRSHSKDIRRKLGMREHNQLRVIPELQFFLDDSLDYIDRIDELLNDK
jgi:ribosome-binding factor A